MTDYINPLVLQRADPFVLRDDRADGVQYYFTGSYPRYDRITLRRAARLDALQAAPEKTIWRAHSSGPLSHLIWAPELHRVAGTWTVYFAAAPDTKISDDTFNHRIYCLQCEDDDPLTGTWIERGLVDTGDTFSLDATTFTRDGVQYLVWAQQDLAIEGHSNIYIARMSNPWTLADRPSLLSHPELDWERVRFAVNEGPAVLIHDNRIFLTYSASGTGPEYAVGLLRADLRADLEDPNSWTKSAQPIFKSAPDAHQYGPGHNSFTTSENGADDLIVYHARNYTEIVGDPLFDPNRHARIGRVTWDEQGSPQFGRPAPDTRWTPTSTEIITGKGAEI
ncbi:Beta-xylosidase, GH43 family [Propionibacterium cyclohexanicum]|uniref:Beta-xylosidase, GH43 family n=1 Tax=Propionibacterium cyclohexanicum TaxID=64702 RepID=A0A1H9PSD7_9ACTN|nr:family 43 glycosylhydrolase [Propionibacterium cyclohexanicum]SER51141.1 Beta-xylosidase, GH43 family [Propionibacterium cyclohexanicum]